MNRKLDIAALALGVLLLALGPLVVTLLRAEDYRSTTTIALSRSNPAAAYLPDPLDALRESLGIVGVQAKVARDVAWFNTASDLPDYVEVRRARPGRTRDFLLIGRGATPERARDLATATAESVLAAAETSSKFTQGLQLKRLAARLRRTPAGSADIRQLQSRRADIATAMRQNRSLWEPQPSAATLTEQKLGDRILGALPVSAPLRPNPVWAALAGIALAAALLLWVVVLSSSDRRKAIR